MPAPAMVLGPTLGGILGASAAWAGKKILQAYLTNQFGGMFGGGQPVEEGEEQPQELFPKRNKRPPYVAPAWENGNFVETASRPRGNLADNPILRSFMEGYS